jgi:hypothetical protein
MALLHGLDEMLNGNEMSLRIGLKCAQHRSAPFTIMGP